jgi:hypothetical protein
VLHVRTKHTTLRKVRRFWHFRDTQQPFVEFARGLLQACGHRQLHVFDCDYWHSLTIAPHEALEKIMC